MIAADDGGTSAGLVLLIFAAYWAPAVVGFVRHHHNRVSILVVNLFLGWTFIGWVVALAMAVGRVERRQTPAKPRA